MISRLLPEALFSAARDAVPPRNQEGSATKRFIATVALLLSAVPSAWAQAVPPDSEPLLPGVFMWFDSSTGMLAELERQLPRARLSKGLVAGAKMEYEIAGKRSPVRIPGDPVPVFVVRVADRGVDPYGLLQFFRMRVDGNKRKMKVGSVSAWDGAVTKGYEDQSVVPFTVAFHGASSYRLTPSAPLEPGEYCVGLSTAEHGFCFGIDPPGVR